MVALNYFLVGAKLFLVSAEWDVGLTKSIPSLPCTLWDKVRTVSNEVNKSRKRERRRD